MSVKIKREKKRDRGRGERERESRFCYFYYIILLYTSSSRRRGARGRTDLPDDTRRAADANSCVFFSDETASHLVATGASTRPEQNNSRARVETGSPKSYRRRVRACSCRAALCRLARSECFRDDDVESHTLDPSRGETLRSFFLICFFFRFRFRPISKFVFPAVLLPVSSVVQVSVAPSSDSRPEPSATRRPVPRRSTVHTATQVSAAFSCDVCFDLIVFTTVEDVLFARLASEMSLKHTVVFSRRVTTHSRVSTSRGRRELTRLVEFFESRASGLTRLYFKGWKKSSSRRGFRVIEVRVTETRLYIRRTSTIDVGCL